MSDPHLMKQISRLGFTKDCIVETILVTFNPDGLMNAAPMGVTWKGSEFEVGPFKSSRTYENLNRGGNAIISLTSDPMLFLLTAFKDHFEEKVALNELRLKESDATISASVDEIIQETDERVFFTLTPTGVVLNTDHPTVFSRGRAQVIEAIIHATRIEVFRDDKEKVGSLRGKIHDNIEVIKRVSDNDSIEVQTAMKLLGLLKKWGVDE